MTQRKILLGYEGWTSHQAFFSPQDNADIDNAAGLQRRRHVMLTPARRYNAIIALQLARQPI
jgi:hypothetical protein